METYNLEDALKASANTSQALSDLEAKFFPWADQ